MCILPSKVDIINRLVNIATSVLGEELNESGCEFTTRSDFKKFLYSEKKLHVVITDDKATERFTNEGRIYFKKLFAKFLSPEYAKRCFIDHPKASTARFNVFTMLNDARLVDGLLAEIYQTAIDYFCGLIYKKGDVSIGSLKAILSGIFCAIDTATVTA